MAKETPVSLFSIAVTLGEIKQAQADMLRRLDGGATKDQFVGLKHDVDKLGEMIRENHSGHDKRIGTLEQRNAGMFAEQGNQKSNMDRVLDVIWKSALAGAAVLVGKHSLG